MFLFVAVETDGVGPCVTQTLIRVALVLTDERLETLLLESCFVQGSKGLNSAVVPWYTLSQVDNGLRRFDAGRWVGRRLEQVLSSGGKVVAHNLEYVLTMLTQLQLYVPSEDGVCTMKLGTPVCKLRSSLLSTEKEYKYPKLGELHTCLLGTPSTVTWRTAEEKAYAVKQCYAELKKIKDMN
jgi:hypothetical protein